ncbi:MAG: hypothetical protein RLZZ214_3112 [Verrucomicrobiota bacterium]
MLTGAGTLVPAAPPAPRRHSKRSRIPGIAAIAAVLAFCPAAHAAVTFSSGYSGITAYTHSDSDDIFSYDWGSDGKIYLGTVTSSSKSGGVYSYDGSSISTIQAASNVYAGTSVVAIGSSVYFNDAATSPNIFRYDITSSTTTSLSTTNYSLATDGINLLTTGSADYTTTHINYYSGGGFAGMIDLGGIDGYSGPAAFDMAGNLFYAPGYGDLSIYRWSAIEVAAAVLGGGSPALSAIGHQWLDYSSSFATAGGAGSLLVDADGNVIVTVTDFLNPSSLVKFSADGGGSFQTLLTSTDRLGELRLKDGNLYLSETNKIITIVPEPSTLLVALSGLGLLLRRRR